MDTDESLSDSWWERVKYYARLAIERVECGVNAVKELLSILTIKTTEFTVKIQPVRSLKRDKQLTSTQI